MKKLILALGATFAFAGSSHAALYSLSGPMDPLQAGTNGGFGGGAGNGSGTIMGQYDDVTNLLDYSITYANLTSPVTIAHFHLGGPGVSGGVQLGIPGPYLAGISTATGVEVDAVGETNLLAGNWYVNIHTADFTGGEIRGQVNVALIPEPSSSLLALGALGGFLVCRRRK